MNKLKNSELIDEDNPEWSVDDVKSATPLNALPASLQAKVRGRPKAIVTKEPVKIRLDADVLAA
jgi:uncharacterized protein (DUF4415 family)